MRKLDQVAYPVLDLPVFQHEAIFAAVEKVLRTDPIFSRTCEMFLSYSGTADDTKGPIHANCPYCRISPGPMTSEMKTERQHDAPMAVAFEVAVKGTNRTTLINFWGTIVAAIYPSDPARRAVVQALLQGAGVTRPVINMQGFAFHGDDTNNYMLVAVGRIVFNSLLTTP